MAKSVTIGCKLPHGIVLEHPMNPMVKVTIQGINKSLVIGSNFITTEVDADFWDMWISVHSEFPAVKSGAIFVAKNEQDARAMAAERKSEKTGFEGMDPAKHGVKDA